MFDTHGHVQCRILEHATRSTDRLVIVRRMNYVDLALSLLNNASLSPNMRKVCYMFRLTCENLTGVR